MMISFIIPTLDEEAVLANTLQNLKRIRSFFYEIIVSDGRSKDSTVAIAKEYADKVLVYEGKERQTIGAARNLAAYEAKGDYLVFLDADVVIIDPEGFFKKALKFFERDSNLLGITVPLIVLEEERTLSDTLFFGISNRFHFFWNNVVFMGSGWGEFLMVKSDAFRTIGGFNESFAAAEDFDLFLRLARQGGTHMAFHLPVYHTGRRAHKIGWPLLLTQWLMNGMGVLLLGHPISKEWTPIGSLKDKWMAKKGAI